MFSVYAASHLNNQRLNDFRKKAARNARVRQANRQFDEVRATEAVVNVLLAPSLKLIKQS